MKQKIVTLGLFVLLGIVLTTFVLTPFTGDIYVFLGSAHQMEFFDGNFLERAFHTWDVKGIFARTFMCALYRIALTFADFASLRFEIYVRLIYLIFALVLLLLSARLLCSSCKRWWLYFTFLALGLFATHYASHLQHEMTAVLIMLLSYAILISNEASPKRRLLKDFLSGLLLGSLPYFKSIFVILPPIVISAVCLTQPNVMSICRQTSYKRLYALILGGLIMGLSGLSLILFLYPEEIQDILDVSAFQSTLISGGFLSVANSLYSFGIAFFCQCLPMNPIVAIGATVTLANLTQDFKSHNIPSLFCHFVLWAVPACFILLSNCFFAYHYYAFVFSAIIECFARTNHHAHEKCGSKIRISVAGILVTLTIIYFANMSVFSGNFSNYIYANDLQHKHHSELFKKFPDIASETILYLDSGQGSYLVGGHSYLKYSYPLPLQRIGVDSKFHKLPCRLRCHEQAMLYNGKYVVLDEQWFCQNGRNLTIANKIKNEYDQVGEVHYMAREWKLFGKPEFTDRIFKLYSKRQLNSKSAQDISAEES